MSFEGGGGGGGGDSGLLDRQHRQLDAMRILDLR